MLSFKLKPFLTKSLIRLGHNSDGGYIINNEILDKSKTLLTFGLADEFSFEKDYKSLKPDTAHYSLRSTPLQIVFGLSIL